MKDHYAIVELLDNPGHYTTENFPGTPGNRLMSLYYEMVKVGESCQCEKPTTGTETTETLQAKLRNQLSPLYGLADCVLLMDERPDLKPLITERAKRAFESKPRIDALLKAIDIGQRPVCNDQHTDNGSGTCMFCETDLRDKL
jgi:hypothetical protein